MTPETVAAVALDILRERGWHQGHIEGDDGSLCLVGAINTACWGQAIYPGFGQNIATRQLSCMAVYQCLGRDPAEFNDDPHTTFEDVTLVLKRVANGEGVE